MLYKGTFVTRGSGAAVVVATGLDTELGEISRLVGESKGEHTPLERRLNALGRRLVYVTIAMAVAATVSGIVTGRGLLLMVETGIALAVAAIPEGLPIVATIALATGLHEMAKRHALVNRLSSVETLGSTTVICTDKTGTLTENRLTVAELALSGDEAPARYEADALAGEPKDVTDRAGQMRRLGALCTNVAAESADMVLTDDALGSVVTAVRYGRIIFANIRKFVVYLMSCNLAQIIAVGAAAVAALPLPLLPLQILFLNVVTGVFPALALGVGQGSGDVMSRPPRDPSSPVLERRHWRALIAFSGLIAVAVVGAFLVALGPLDLGDNRSVTVGFLTLAFSQIWHVFNMRGAATRWYRNDITLNPWVWGAIVLCLGLVVGAATLPGVSSILSLAPIPATGWYLALGGSLLPLLLGPLVRRLVSSGREVFA